MNDALILLVAALAVYRISRMVTMERGPGDLFTRLQNLGEPGGWVNDGFNCPLCVSFWLGIAAALIVAAGWWWLLVPFALSGGAVLLHLNSKE